MFQAKKCFLAVLLTVGFWISCNNIYADKLDNVLMSDALVIGRINLTKIQQSSIAKLIRKDDTVSSEIKVDKINTVLKKYNLSEEDFTDFVVGFKLDVENFKNIDDALQKDGNKEFVFGAQMTKTITLEQLKNIIIDSSKLNNNNDVDVKITEKDGIKLLWVSDKEKKSTQPFALAVQDKEKIIIGGFPAAVIDSVKRMKTGKNLVLNTELTKLKSKVSKKADFYLLAYMPEAIRDKIGLKREKKPTETTQNNTNTVEVFKDINALSVQAEFAGKLDLNVFAYFISRNSSQDAQKLINQFLPMIKFMAMSSTQGVSLPIMDSIECKISKTEPEIEIHLALTEKDIKVIQTIVNKKNAVQ